MTPNLEQCIEVMRDFLTGHLLMCDNKKFFIFLSFAIGVLERVKTPELGNIILGNSYLDNKEADELATKILSYLLNEKEGE